MYLYSLQLQLVVIYTSTEVQQVRIFSLPGSRNISIRRSLFTRDPPIVFTLSRQVQSKGFQAKSQ